MTRFTPPLTFAETTALQQACAAMDTERLERIEHCIRERDGWLKNPGSLEKSAIPITAEEEYMIAHAYERAIGFLAYQLTLH